MMFSFSLVSIYHKTKPSKWNCLPSCVWPVWPPLELKERLRPMPRPTHSSCRVTDRCQCQLPSVILYLNSSVPQDKLRHQGRCAMRSTTRWWTPPSPSTARRLSPPPVSRFLQKVSSQELWLGMIARYTSLIYYRLFNVSVSLLGYWNMIAFSFLC